METYGVALGAQNECDTRSNPYFNGLLPMVYLTRDQKTKDLFAFAEDNRTSIVYMATNALNGKRYIGITRKGMEKRQKQHHAFARHGSTSHFHRAIRKHGIEVFNFVILVHCTSYKEACAEEMRLITDYAPEYNMSAGGDGPIGYRHSAESRARMRQAKLGKPSHWKGKQQSPESIAKRTATRALNPVRPWLGKKRDAATVEKLKIAATRRCRWVTCINDGRRYLGCGEAARAYGLVARSVADVCRGKAKTLHGYRFKYEDTP